MSCLQSLHLEGTLQNCRKNASNKCTQVIQAVFLNLFSLHSLNIWHFTQHQSILQCLEFCLCGKGDNSFKTSTEPWGIKQAKPNFGHIFEYGCIFFIFIEVMLLHNLSLPETYETKVHCCRSESLTANFFPSRGCIKMSKQRWLCLNVSLGLNNSLGLEDTHPHCPGGAASGLGKLLC